MPHRLVNSRPCADRRTRRDGGAEEQEGGFARYVARVCGRRAAAGLLRPDRGRRRRPRTIVRFYERYAGRGELSHLQFFPWPPDACASSSLGAGRARRPGGNTANLLAIWRLHGFDAIVREAWEDGVVLTGWSAGMICWFEAGVTDSFGPQLEGMRDGLGFLAGSACPHYDGEERRRPVYTRLVATRASRRGSRPTTAPAVWYEGTELREVVTVP